MKDPETPEEWQEAVNGASFLFLVDAARKFGFVTGGPEINFDRCEEILDRGAELGYRPDPLSKRETP